MPVDEDMLGKWWVVRCFIESSTFRFSYAHIDKISRKAWTNDNHHKQKKVYQMQRD